MSWDNRNRISVARGRNTAIANETTLQGNGQIIYNQDRHYITVGEPYNNNNRTPANNVPIRVRTVEG